MHFPDLKKIRFGEIVIFTNTVTEYQRSDVLYRKIFRHELPGFNVRFEETNVEQLAGLAVARRPLLLAPEREAYVATNLRDNFFDISSFAMRIKDFLDSDAPELELCEGQPHFSVSACFSDEIEDNCSADEYGDYSSSYSPCDEAPVSRKSHASKPGILNGIFGSIGTKPKRVIKKTVAQECTEIEEQTEKALEFDQKQWIDKFSALVLEYVAANNALPPDELINQVIRGKLQISRDNELSPIVVNGDMRIILPAYNELELRMTPLARTVYILFLCHPEGIVLKNIGEYREQLRDIYLLVKPGADSRLADEYIDELTYPGSDSLQQKLSLIKKAINRYIIPPTLAQAYHITGTRGNPYKIANLQVTLPAALQNSALQN